MYVPKHFELHEYLPKSLYNHLRQRGRLDRGWELLDDRLLRLDDQLREKFGKITINNWYWGGDREWSGIRTPDSAYFSPTSQHTYGRASDKLFRDNTITHVRSYILENPDEFPLLMSLELDVTWLHSDVRNCKRIKTYRP